MTDIDQSLRVLDRFALQKMSDAVHGIYFEELFLPFKNFAPELDKDMARSVCRSLAARGYAKYSRALTTEDGDFAGAGYGITKAGAEYLKTITPHAYEAAFVEAIQFAIGADEGIEFLRLWNVGDWDAIDKEWPDFHFVATGKERRLIEWEYGATVVGYIGKYLMYNISDILGPGYQLRIIEFPLIGTEKIPVRSTIPVNMVHRFNNRIAAQKFAQADFDRRQHADFPNFGPFERN